MNRPKVKMPKIYSVLLVALILTGSFLIYQLSKSSVSAYPHILSIELLGPRSLGVNATGTYTINDTLPNAYFQWYMNGSLVSEGKGKATYAFTCDTASNDTYRLSLDLTDVNGVWHGWIDIIDPFTASGVYLDTLPIGGICETDGLGWFQLSFNGQQITSGTNSSALILSALATYGTVTVESGTWNAALGTLPQNKTLIIKTGATGITYTASTGNYIHDYNSGQTYLNGSLTVSGAGTFGSLSNTGTGTFGNVTLSTGVFPSSATYTIYVDGANYVAKHANGTICWTSTNITSTANTVISALSSGGNVLFKTGTYTLNGSITASNIDSVALMFEEGAVLYVADGMNAAAIFFNNTNNCLIQGVTINGNSANQEIGTHPYTNGITISGSNNKVADAIISDCRVTGVHIISLNSTSTINSGIMDSKITGCGWNGITLGGNDYTKEVSLFAIHNEIAYSGDVGIASYGNLPRIQNNYVHDMNGTTGFSNAHWGIAIEGGGNATVTENTITDTAFAIAVTNSGNTAWGNCESNKIALNTINICNYGIFINANKSTVFDNTVTDYNSGGWYTSIAYTVDVTDCDIQRNFPFNDGAWVGGCINASSIYLMDTWSNSTWLTDTEYINIGSPKTFYFAGGANVAVILNGILAFYSADPVYNSVTLYNLDRMNMTWTSAPTITPFRVRS